MPVYKSVTSVGDYTSLLAAFLDDDVKTVILVGDILSPVSAEIVGGRQVELDGQGHSLSWGESKAGFTLLRVAAGARLALKNVAVKGDSRGGHLIINYGQLDLLAGATLENNVDKGLCGGGLLNLGRLFIQEGTIQNNEGLCGGGVFNLSGLIGLQSGSRIEGNRAASGGGLVNRYGLVQTEPGPSAGPDYRIISFNGAKRGGGLVNDGGLTRFNDPVRLADNEAECGRALANLNGGFMRLSKVTVVGRSSGNGESGPGGLWNQGARLDFVQGTVQKCRTTGDGAGLLNDGGLAKLHPKTQIINNQAANGGGMANKNGGSLSVGGTVMHNAAKGGLGGGIYNAGADLILNDPANVSGNQAECGGGAANSAESGFTMLGGLISDNSSLKSGGGIYTPGHFEQKGGTVSGNFAGEGERDISKI